ncbi:MAG: metallophosphoesterase [Candidatus Eisenbacteria bacterium]|nr:metallophosphoesterase [Candidatus Eisenbacteria bacterium]
MTAATLLLLGGCARIGRLQHVQQPISPAFTDSTQKVREDEENEESEEFGGPISWQPLFGDTLIGLVPGTADTSLRFLGRLRAGYTADTLNIILFGDNRPSYRTSRLRPEFTRIKQAISLNPIKILRGLITIPVLLAKGLYPDLALIRDIPALIKHSPNYGREAQVLKAVMTAIDSIEAGGETVAAVINTGDLVKDGRYPAHWERFLRLTRPLSSRVPYFPIAGNHERTDTDEGVENWRTATGLPITGDRLYYSFDSADGWVRFIALDSNPMTDPANYWSREVEIKYSDEQIDWLQKSLKSHRGPAFVFMHHPPFSTGFHRGQWQNDDVLRERRERMVRTLKESGISILATGHEHAYERALLTWDDAVLISIVAGGGGSPLHAIPSAARSAQMFSEYKVAGSVIKPENVMTAINFHFVHLRLWFGGGEFHTFAVDKDGSTRLIDEVQIDLKRYGVPEIDQFKIPVPKEGPVEPTPTVEDKQKGTIAAKTDSVSADDKLKNEPPPGGKPPR